jgi:hypothetical protein
VHELTVIGDRDPKDLPMLHWLNIALGNRKTSLIGVCHALGDRRCAPYAPGAIADRFSRAASTPMRCRRGCCRWLSRAIRA